MTAAELYALIRADLNDNTVPPQYSDNYLARELRRALDRAERILIKNEIPVAKDAAEYTTAAEQYAYDLPDDFIAPVGLYRDSDGAVLELVDSDKWARLSDTPEARAWLIQGAELWLKGTPATEQGLTLWYWQSVDKDLGSTDDLPWAGRVDYSIADYIVARINNKDGLNSAMDADFLRDMENGIIETFQLLGPIKKAMTRGPYA